MIDPSTPSGERPDDFMHREYAARQALLATQTPLTQRFLEAQARVLADAVIERLPVVRLTLPDQVIVDASGKQPAQVVPAAAREQVVGNLLDRLARPNTARRLRQQLAELAQSPDPALVAAAELIRYVTVVHMVHNMLPDGRSVTYAPVEGEEIPNLPVDNVPQPESAITASSDAIVEGEGGAGQEGRGELQVPYTPAARRFYLPQWVAFDDEDRLLVNTVGEAEAAVASMQRFLAVLHAAVALAPYVVADPVYQRKRYGMLGQLVNQGRALARFKTGEIVRTIRERAAAHSLNRGLSLSLPYFDDQLLLMKKHNFQVIPRGRIMFVPAFVVRAAREESAKVAQDTRLNPSTRNHLLAELKSIEQAFEA